MDNLVQINFSKSSNGILRLCLIVRNYFQISNFNLNYNFLKKKVSKCNCNDSIFSSIKWKIRLRF